MGMLRADIESLEQNGITGVALKRLGDPEVIALWFGEGDLVTPDFIRDAAKQALDEGYTFAKCLLFAYRLFQVRVQRQGFQYHR